MRIDAERTLIQMTERQALRLTDAQGTRLRAVAGTSWVTIDHDGRDLLLEPGDELLIASPQPVFASALSGCATLSVMAQPPRIGLLQRTIERLRRPLRAFDAGPPTRLAHRIGGAGGAHAA